MKKEDKLGRACSTIAGDDNCVYDIAGRAIRKETRRRMWMDNITLVLREILWDVMDWIDLATIVNTARNAINSILFVQVAQEAAACH